MRILIVKMSSLGDIIHTLPILNYLHFHFPQAKIDWVVEKRFSELLHSQRLIAKVIEIPLKEKGGSLLSSMRNLRKEKYTHLFDFQGNIKSGVFTFLARSKVKVGFSFSSVREWPNILVTDTRFSCNEEENIRMKALSLLQQYFCRIKPDSIFCTKKAKSFPLEKPIIMVCPGSRWDNKKLSTKTLRGFLKFLEDSYQAVFIFVWGSPEEKKECEVLDEGRGQLLEKRLEPSSLVKLMNKVDLVIAVDSALLHLCGMTETPTFSVFGPTNAEVFKPMGEKHSYFQGTCPYGQPFVKQCPLLRTCSTGACMKEITASELVETFQREIKRVNSFKSL